MFQIRVKSNRCNGFIGFYSTIASSGLTRKLEGWAEEDRKEFQIFHRGNIESQLLGKQEGLQIAQRYFPQSMKKWQKLNSSVLYSSIQPSKNKDIRQQFYEEYTKRKKQEEN